MPQSPFYNALLTNLSARFHKPEVFAGRFALGVLSKTPMLFYGKGGLGKSEMIQVGLETIGLPYLVLDCTSETTAADLFGGCVAQTILHNPKDATTRGTDITSATIDYSQGFLNYEVVVLEEMADAPPRTLSALKTALTVGAWNGHPSKNLITIGATNTALEELLEEMDPGQARSFNAFRTRWIEVDHTWSSYDPEQYIGVLDKASSPRTPLIQLDPKSILKEIELVKKVIIPNRIKITMAELFSKITTAGRIFLGGRDIIYAARIAQTYAYMLGDAEVDLRHLAILELFGAGVELSELEELVQEAERSQRASSALQELREKLKKVLAYYAGSGNEHFKAMTVSRNLDLLMEQCSGVVTTDSTHSALEELKQRIKAEKKTADAAVESTASTEVLV
jgi:MoxR-like ATPase